MRVKRGNIALIIIGLGIVVSILVVVLVKPPEPKDKYGELGKRKAEQETKAASPSASPVEATPSASP